MKILAAAACLSFCSVSASAADSKKDDYLATVRIDELLPSKKSASEPDRHIRRGVKYLQKGKLDKASKEFNSALRFSPQNSYYQFFNGLTYHLRARAGKSSEYESAKIGYDLALKFDGTNWLAAQQLGRLHMDLKRYPEAQDAFARALLRRPDSGELLHGLARASYRAGDLETALGAVRRAREITPGSADIIATQTLIFAAAGRLPEAREGFALLRDAGEPPLRVARLGERIEGWERLHDALNDEAVDSSEDEDDSDPGDAGDGDGGAGDGSRPPAAEGEGKPVEPKMVVLDVTMVRTEETDESQKGLNLLQGLTLTFTGDFDTKEVRNPPAADPVDINHTLHSNLTIPQVTYSLNVMNASENRAEVIARPTLISLDGRQSTFFAGSEVNVAVIGDEDADTKNFEAGTTLKVTPVFLEDGRIQLDVEVERSFFEATSPGTFKESVKRSINKVTANVVMDFNQTLILSGLREKQKSENKSGVPLLRDIPIVQYLFSSEKTFDFHKSLLIFVTPRRVIYGVDSSDYSQREDGEWMKNHVIEFKERYGSLFDHDINILHTMRHLSKHAAYQELHNAGTFDTHWWGEPESLKIMLRRTLSFLYY